jgi:hypothetical protein
VGSLPAEVACDGKGADVDSGVFVGGLFCEFKNLRFAREDFQLNHLNFDVVTEL